MISDRSWNQIQAALRLWQETCRTSRVPPWMHPAIRPFFENGRPSLLTPDEVEALINSDPPAGAQMGYPAKYMADATGIRFERLLDWLHRAGIKPIGAVGTGLLWDWDDLRLVADEILAKDRGLRKRYAKSLATTNTQTQSD